jgi:hypothetical protein
MKSKLLFWRFLHDENRLNGKTVIMDRKIGLSLILGGLLLAAVGCGGNSGSSRSQTSSVSVDSQIKETIEAYFTNRFDSQKTLSYSKLDGNIMANNDDTQLDETFHKISLAQKKLVNNSISNYQYQINYQKSSVNGDEASVELSLNLYFHYQKAPSDLDSAICGVNYSFVLKNNESNWVITQIDSDLEEFETFKNQVQEAMEQDTTLSKAAAIQKVDKTVTNEIELMRNNSIYLKGEARSSEISPDGGSESTESSNISKSIYISCRKYTYNPSCAVAYAAKYYNAETTRDSLFYILDYDCTNFVSQCVWAGYVGFDADSIDTFKNYIAKKNGMLYNEWYAGTGGGANSWENAAALFEYMVNSKAAGPNATTDFSDYNAKHHYRTISAASINVGDVIQLWYRTRYSHSIIITRKTNNTSNCGYGDIYYSGHTNSRWNWSFWEAIYSSNYMRRLTPATTCYLK